MAEKGAETEEGRRGRGGPFVVADDLTVGGYDGRLTAAFFVALAAAHPWTHPHPLPRKGWRLRCSLLYTHATQQPYFASVLGRGGDRAAGPAARTLERRKKKKKKKPSVVNRAPEMDRKTVVLLGRCAGLIPSVCVRARPPPSQGARPLRGLGKVGPLNPRVDGAARCRDLAMPRPRG